MKNKTTYMYTYTILKSQWVVHVLQIWMLNQNKDTSIKTKQKFILF